MSEHNGLTKDERGAYFAGLRRRDDRGPIAMRATISAALLRINYRLGSIDAIGDGS